MQTPLFVLLVLLELAQGSVSAYPALSLMDDHVDTELWSDPAHALCLWHFRVRPIAWGKFRGNTLQSIYLQRDPVEMYSLPSTDENMSLKICVKVHITKVLLKKSRFQRLASSSITDSL